VAKAGTARVATAPVPHPRHAVENIDIARIFEEIADLLEIQGENQFRVRAYRTAARTIETLGVPAASLAVEGRLDELPGIGSDLAGKVCTILETGTLPLLQRLTAKTPESLVQMLKIPGLGPKARSRSTTRSVSRRWPPSRARREAGSSGNCPVSRARSNTRFCRALRTYADTAGDGGWPTPMRTSIHSSRI
jgi:hypothetical protein